MDLKKYSFKKNNKNSYKVDIKNIPHKNINKNKRNTEDTAQKISIFDKINKISFQKYIRIALPIISSCVIIAGIIFGSMQIYKYITNSDNFLLTEIYVNGNQYLTDKEIISLAGLQKNKNIFNYQIEEIEAKLLASNWIQDVKITRTLPSTFKIEIIEHKPIFIIIRDNKLYYLNNKAQFIDTVNKNKFISLPILYINNATNNEIKILPDFINELETTKFPYALNEISWININPLYGFEIFVEANNLTLQIDKQNYEQNIKNLISVIEDLKKRKEISKVRKIRAAFNKVMIIKE